MRDYAESDLYALLYRERRLVDGFDKEMCIYDSTDFSRFRYVRSESLKQARLTLQYRNQMGALDILDDVRDFVAKHGRTGTKDICSQQKVKQLFEIKEWITAVTEPFENFT